MEVTDSESNVVQSNEVLTLETVIQNHVTGTVVGPGTASPALINRPLLDDVQHLLEKTLVVIVEMLVIRHNAVHQMLASKSQVVVIFMVHMALRLIVPMGWLLPDFVVLTTKVCSQKCQNYFKKLSILKLGSHRLKSFWHDVDNL